MAGCPNLRTACPGRALAGRKSATRGFGRCRRIATWETRAQLLNSRRVARPTATKSASGVWPHPPEPTLRFPIYDYDFRRSPEAAAPARSSPSTATTVGVLYYGQRYYNPSTGRWLSRDPFDENGGINLFEFASNRPTSVIDLFGLDAPFQIDPSNLLSQLPPLPHSNLLGPNSLQYSGTDGQRQEYTGINQIQNQLNGGMPLSQLEIRSIHRGCIGLCSLYQGLNADHPEDVDGVEAFLDFGKAAARKCPCGTRKFVFGKQGYWNDGTPPPEDPEGRVDPESISNKENHFNYLTYFPTTKTFAWMNHNDNGDPQTLYIWNRYPISASYPHTVWYSMCIQQQ